MSCCSGGGCKHLLFHDQEKKLKEGSLEWLKLDVDKGLWKTSYQETKFDKDIN